MYLVAAVNLFDGVQTILTGIVEVGHCAGGLWGEKHGKESGARRWEGRGGEGPSGGRWGRSAVSPLRIGRHETLA